MTQLVIAAADFNQLKRNLLHGEKERCAVLFAAQTKRIDGSVRLLVQDVEFAKEQDYLKTGPIEAELSPSFVAGVTKRARQRELALFFVHSHPDDSRPRFSGVDDDGEGHLLNFLQRRVPNQQHGAMVISPGGVAARELGNQTPVEVVSLGETREVLTELPAMNNFEERFDRQIRAFGQAGQQKLRALKIAVVGLGGTGSIVAQELAHLGVSDYVLIDPDVVDETNLNRLVGAAADDLRQLKVAVADRAIKAVHPDAAVTRIAGNVIDSSTAKELLAADLIFGCTDSHGSRAVLQQVSYQYMIPLIDMGVTISVTQGHVRYVYGRVQLLSPGLPCFTCCQLLDSNQVRQDMMTPFERQQDPYIQGHHEPAPAVISLNGTVASLAVTMMLAYTIGLPSKCRYLLYNAMTATIRQPAMTPDPHCYVCSPTGSYAKGDSWPLFARETPADGN